MKVHYLQHVSFEGMGSLKESLLKRDYGITGTHFFEKGHILPPVNDIDFLVVMGGPMSVHDTRDYPWLEKETAFIKTFIRTGKPVLGICLGAQLIATALGAAVYPNHTKEIGWFPLEKAGGDTGSAFQFPEKIDVFHWHGETFDLPSGALRLASSSGCKNQAFQMGDSVIGLQFHLETTFESASAIVSHCRDELVGGEYIQSESEIMGAVQESYSNINRLMEKILDFLLR